MANIKIAQLTNKTTLADTDTIIVETATATEKMTVANLKSLLGIQGGGVVESGSNANGKYVKFADGTMICWNNPSTSLAGFTWNQGSGLYYKAVPLPDFPVPFVGERPSLFKGLTIFGGLYMWGGSGSANNYSVTSPGDVYIYAMVNTVPTVLGFSYIAVGRWKA